MSGLKEKEMVEVPLRSPRLVPALLGTASLLIVASTWAKAGAAVAAPVGLLAASQMLRAQLLTTQVTVTAHWLSTLLYAGQPTAPTDALVLGRVPPAGLAGTMSRSPGDDSTGWSK